MVQFIFVKYFYAKNVPRFIHKAICDKKSYYLEEYGHYKWNLKDNFSIKELWQRV
jgi:hypothetical protein